MTKHQEDYYRILQVDPAADPEVITAAYRRLAVKYHPDTNASPDAHARMQRINEAYAVLSDTEKREIYDRSRRVNGAVSAPITREPQRASTHRTMEEAEADFIRAKRAAEDSWKRASREADIERDRILREAEDNWNRAKRAAEENWKRATRDAEIARDKAVREAEDALNRMKRTSNMPQPRGY